MAWEREMSSIWSTMASLPFCTLSCLTPHNNRACNMCRVYFSSFRKWVALHRALQKGAVLPLMPTKIGSIQRHKNMFIYSDTQVQINIDLFGVHWKYTLVDIFQLQSYTKLWCCKLIIKRSPNLPQGYPSQVTHQLIVGQRSRSQNGWWRRSSGQCELCILSSAQPLVKRTVDSKILSRNLTSKLDLKQLWPTVLHDGSKTVACCVLKEYVLHL